MWVLLALFYAEPSDVPINIKVYNNIIFETEQQCFDSMMDNRQNIVDSLSKLEISSKYSVKCIDAEKYPSVMLSLNPKRS